MTALIPFERGERYQRAAEKAEGKEKNGYAP